jgi:hypothetical protein
MHWHFDTATHRLHVSNAQLDFRPVRALLCGGWVPAEIAAIVFSTPEMTYVVCGFILREWIAGRDPSARTPAALGCLGPSREEYRGQS